MTHESDLLRRKADVRAHARGLRCELDAATCASHAHSAALHLLSLEELVAARVVLAYAANAEEIDPAPALAMLRELGATIALPRVEEHGVLGLHVVGPGEALVTGAFGIGEPRADAPRIAPADVDAVIVPGVAFDESGRRLGYGGGYYDRLLPQLRPAALRVGLAYDEQILDALPAAEHDAHVHALVTPTRVVRIATL
ncbi:MAG TPA: 5-formyltetrahydrofolate cyclo-ligase [Coriobacteriia bacterium]|nr:5-formyltetrahydrofolate cyclo-ligase [Coriobacteriia bacterium]